MAQRACAVDHSSGACAIEGAQAVSAQISAQMELSYTVPYSDSRHTSEVGQEVEVSEIRRRC